MKALQFSVNVPKFMAAKTLRAVFGNRIFYKGPVKTIGLRDIPEPEPPNREWVKIRTLFCGFCGSDLNLIRLHDSPTASPFTSFPCVTGHEVVGEIMGQGAGDFAPGDIVAVNPILGCEAREIDPPCPACRAGRSGNCENFARGRLAPGMFLGINRGVSGGFAPFLTAHRSQLFKVPKGLSLKSAAMAEPLAVALQTVFDNLPNPGETSLVMGGGVIGNLIVQSIRTLVPDCPVFVVEPAAHAADLALKAGAKEVIPVDEIFNRTCQATGARAYTPMLGRDILMGGFNRIYDTVGSSATLNLGMRVLAALGTLSVVGIGREVKLDLTPLWLKLQTLKGVYAYGRVSYRGRDCHVFDLALEFMDKGRIDAQGLVTHTFGLEDYCEMIEMNLDKGRYKAVKTLVDFTRPSGE